MMAPRHVVRVASFAACIAAASGCLTSNVLVTVRPDGSGTIDQTASIRPAAMAAFERLLPPDVAGGSAVWKPSLPSTRMDRIRWAAQFGPNVTLASIRPADTADTLGWIARYDFDDVRLLSVDLLPYVGAGSGFYGLAAADVGASTRLRMTLEPAGDRLARLTVRFPRFALDTSAEPLSATATGPAEEMAALRQLLTGSRVTVAVETEAPLVRTNSPHHELNRVTLLDVDVPAALFSKQMQMLVSQPPSFDELLWTIEVLPGVTLAHDHDVTLDFQNAAAQAPPSTAPATQRPPDTEIFLSSLSLTAGKLSVGTPVNITNSPGYDNQPSFTPNGAQILFASVRGGPGGPPAAVPPAAVQTDIYRYDIASKRTSRVTQTPESEYSPALMADGTRTSVVRVEADGTQRLWSVAPSGPKISLAVLLPDVKPVGYYAWMDDIHVALFVLGSNGQPATLQVGNLDTGKTETVAIGIGRSLQRTPAGRISFVQLERGADGAALTPTIKQIVRTGSGMEVVPLVKAVDGSTDPYIAWMPDETVLMTYADTLYSWRAGDAAWTAVADLGALGLHGVSRLAVSPKGDRLAIVGQSK